MLTFLTTVLSFQVTLAATIERSPASNVIAKRATTVSGTAAVRLDKNTGKPQHLASGFIYGIPDTPNQIPDHFYTDIGFNFGRAGGAQTPQKGWLAGIDQYVSALSNYRTCRKYGASFNLLIHDIWGADGGQKSTDPYPGDNGDWTSFDNYLTRLLSDMKANGMTEGIVFDVWNEPDLTIFWNRPQAQWIQMWGRAVHRIRRGYPGASFSGPSLANGPSTTNTWWTEWAKFIAANNSAPSQYSWHMEGGGGDMQSAVASYKSVLQNAGLSTHHPLNINEYATHNEQYPSAGAWWISQLERVNAIGLRGNWLSAGALHDFMAGLLGKPNAGTTSYDPKAGGYWPAAEFQVYKYYNMNMTGYRVATETTADKMGDVYAVVGDDRVRLLVGARIVTGTWTINVSRLSRIGLPTSGEINLHTYRFDAATNQFQRFDSPSDLGVSRHAYSNNEINISVNSTDPLVGFAFEFSRKAGVTV